MRTASYRVQTRVQVKAHSYHPALWATMEAAVERFHVLVDRSQRLQTLIIQQAGTVKMPVLYISLTNPKHLSKFPDRCIGTASVEENDVDPEKPDLHDELHKNFSGYLLVGMRLEFNGQKYATAVKCKDLEAEAAITTVVPEAPTQRGWPWCTMQKHWNFTRLCHHSLSESNSTLVTAAWPSG